MNGVRVASALVRVAGAAARRAMVVLVSGPYRVGVSGFLAG